MTRVFRLWLFVAVGVGGMACALEGEIQDEEVEVNDDPAVWAEALSSGPGATECKSGTTTWSSCPAFCRDQSGCDWKTWSSDGTSSDGWCQCVKIATSSTPGTRN